MRAVGYIRVSTDAQGERGYGLDAQREAIEAEATRRGWTLERVYVDVASGKSVRHRPEFGEMLHALAAGEAEVLIVAKLDRLSRSLVDFAQLMATAQAEGWSVNALDIGVDTSSINGELIANIIMALAQWERRIIGQRTTAALAQVRARGTRLGRRVTTDGTTEALVQTMKREGLSNHAVARRLNELEVPTAQGGAQWYHSTVAALLRRLEAEGNTA